MKIRDLISSVLWMGFAMLFIIGGLDQGLIRRGAPGPGFVPFLTGIALVGLALLVFFPALIGKRGEDAVAVEKFFPEQGSLKRILLALLALVVYGLILNFAGYLITTFLFMTFACRLMEPEKWRTVLIVSAATAGLSYLLFIRLLDVPLPIGILGV